MTRNRQTTFPPRPDVLAVDPGGKTGYVWLQGGRVVEQAELPADEFLDRAAWIVPQVDVVVCETFDITQQTLRVKKGERWWSLEQLGVLRNEARKAGKEFVESPRSALALVPDARLAPFGLNKRGGDGHWRDAARHLVRYFVKRKEVELAI